MKRPTRKKRSRQGARGAKASERGSKAEERSRPPSEQPRASEHAPEAAAAAPAEEAATGPEEEARPSEADGFPIVAIGASAGGLEALEAFLNHVPERSGLAFVVIQHLDPLHKGAMVELLQRASRMPVVQVKDGLRVEADHVYVIPPNRDMSILHRTLHLTTQAAPRGLNLPIDLFFRSLAEDQQDRSIAVVLSGMGSDGTLGLRAIKEKAGAAFVQEPASAKFDGMPRSALDAGLADVVAAVEELPDKIIAYIHHTPRLAAEERTGLHAEKAQSGLEKVFVLLRSRTGNDFSLYKKSTVYRRVERRMGLHQIDNIANYVRVLKENPKEIELLFKELLIGVTSFFRDPAAWEHLARDLMPSLLAERSRGSVIRAWVAGCSTGEEAYSLAIVLKETLEQLQTSRSVAVQVFATDLDRDAIEKARLGLYPETIAADVSPERLRRFFSQEDGGYRVSKDIREMVVFAPQNVIADPPFTKLDVVSCRNLLIYLSADVQRRLVPLFHYSLNPGGLLFLGSSETIGAFSALFAPADGKTRLYRRLAALGAPAIEFPALFAHEQLGAPGGAENDARTARPPPNLQVLADQVLVQRFSPAGVLTNEKGDILYTTGRTGKYLEPAVGKVNWNVFAMAREGLRVELGSAFSAALRQDAPVTVPRVKVGTNGGAQFVDVTVQRLSEPKELRGMVMIVFADMPTPTVPASRASRVPARHGARIGELESELQRAREEVQTIREEMQTSQEELKSTNEEFQSTNEELQSTNEELTTSKEEMQSLNEELQTVNQELQAKVDDLSRTNNDMKNLLNSTDIATLFLDGELRVRRFTPQASKIIKLIPGDAGRPITDLAAELDYPALADDVREVLQTLIFKETTVAAREGRWFAVRIMPYRTLENVIDGVVITFTDATARKGLERALLEQPSEMRQLADSLPALVWTCRADGACEYLSQAWLEYTGIPEPEQLGFGWLQQIHPDERDKVKARWSAAVQAKERFRMNFRLRGRSGEYRWFAAQAVLSSGDQGNRVRWYGTATDVDDLMRAERDRNDASERLATILDGIDEGFLALTDDLTVIAFNAAAERALDRKRDAVVGRPFFDAFPETRGSPLEEKYRQALQEGAPLSFEAHLPHPPYQGWYNMRVYPHRGGVSVFFQRHHERRPATPPGGEPAVRKA
jgi:two-component system CheB/CheR fusion protein